MGGNARSNNQFDALSDAIRAAAQDMILRRSVGALRILFVNRNGYAVDVTKFAAQVSTRCNGNQPSFAPLAADSGSSRPTNSPMRWSPRSPCASKR